MAVFEDLSGDLGSLLRGLVALPCALLPARRWDSHPSLPIERMAFLSGLLTLLAGFLFGVHHGLAYLRGVGDAIADAALALNVKSIPVLPVQSASSLSPLFFLLATPKGWISDYLVLSGFARVLGAWFRDPIGDPILTGLDRLWLRLSGSARATHLRRSREREEGVEVPDRLFTGAWAGLPAADLVVVASRRKPDWTKGTFVFTDDRCYMLGEPFDLRLPQGLRAVYPLTEQNGSEVVRRGVRYDLPPLDPSPPRRPVRRN